MEVIGWAIDPGITNIVYCVPIGSDGRPIPKESWNRVIHGERRTNLEYYNQGHIFKENDIKNKWLNERRVRTTLDARSRKASLKTMDLALLRKRLGCYYEYSRKMWMYLAEPYKWTSLRLHVEGRKKSVRQKFVNRLVLDSHRESGTMPVILFGDGGKTHGFWFKGTRAVPQYFQELLLENGFQCRETDEFRTRSVVSARFYHFCVLATNSDRLPSP